jgi:hypothetical protein
VNGSLLARQQNTASVPHPFPRFFVDLDEKRDAVVLPDRRKIHQTLIALPEPQK